MHPKNILHMRCMRSTRYPKNILHMRCMRSTRYPKNILHVRCMKSTRYPKNILHMRCMRSTRCLGWRSVLKRGALTWSSLKWFQSVVVRTKQNKNTQKRRRKTEREKKKKETDYDRHGPNSLLMVQVVLICAFTSSHNHHFDSPKFGPSLIERWPCVGSIECSTVWVRSVLTTKPRQALLDSTSVDSKELKNGPSPCLIQESNTANPV